ncbi:fun14 domain containing [Holotrichia oblita]|uniref:Fun14 domain containing n=2 Tax=Holotrichia oblita TaxID=644536 RepID=A0ACB9SQ76_HOLOL|nr:fun14 domain containing [Holotrichia oblita]KAI4456154.1 fun14 domain containing [Holotrichia oblita]
MKNIKGTLQSMGISIKNPNAVKQLVAGSAAGFATGYLTMMVGKKVIFAVGGSIVAFQLAQSYGVTKMNWDDVRSKTKAVVDKLDTNDWRVKAKVYAKSNMCFTASFVGGFLMGASYT